MVNFLAHIFVEPINLWVMGICYFVPFIILVSNWRNLDLPIIQSIPGFCTAVGIMFTFGIIYQTLGINDDLFKNNEIASLKLVVKTLSYKFSCSLIGVFFSIAWNLVIKGVISYRESRSNRKEEWRRRDPQEILWSIEQSALEISNEYRLNTENISKAILETANQSKGMIQRISTIIEEGARKEFKKMLEELSNSVKKSVENMSQDAMRESKNNIETTNQEFLSKTKEILSSNQGEFGKLLTASTEALEKILTKLNDIGGSIQLDMEETRKGAKQGAKVVADGFNVSADTIKTGFNEFIGSIAQKFDDLNKGFEDLAQQLQLQTQKILDDNLEKVEKAFGRLDGIQANSINRLEASTDKFNSSVHSFEQLQDHQYGVLERVQHQIVLLKQLQENAEAQLKEWDEQVDQMAEVRNRVADIANAITELQNIKDWFAQNTSRN